MAIAAKRDWNSLPAGAAPHAAGEWLDEAEAKELLAGFFLLDCAGPERAVEIAGQIPEAAFGLVEVRPILQLGG